MYRLAVAVAQLPAVQPVVRQGAEGIQESGAAVAQELGPPAAGMESPQLEVAAAAAVVAARAPVAVGSEKEIELVSVVVAVEQDSALLAAELQAVVLRE